MLTFTCDAADLRRWIPLLKGSLPSRSHYALPVLTGVRIARAGSTCTLTTTDLELTTHIHIPVSDTPVRSTIVVPFAELAAASKGSKGPVTVRQCDDADEAIIESSNGTVTVRLLPADEYPRLRDLGAAGGRFSVGTDRLKRVILAASRDEARPILNGLFVDAKTQRLVTTDSYRLAITPAEITVAGSCGDLIPRASVEQFLRVAGKDPMVNVELHDREARMVVERDGETVETYSVLIEGEFPPYERLYPATWRCKLPLPDGLVDKIKTLNGRGSAVPLVVRVDEETGDSLKIDFTVQDVGTTVLHEGPLEGYLPGGTIGLNPDYLSQGITACGGSEIVLHFQDHLKPTAMAGAGVWYLLMPVRTASNSGPSQVDQGHDLPVPTVEDVKSLDEAKPGPAPKRTGKVELVTFLTSVVRDLPDSKRAEAERLLAAA